MKINNKKEVAIALNLFFFIILLDIVFLIIPKKILPISQVFLYSSFLIVLIFSLWRILTLKIFSMEVSEHIFTIKYRHPLSKVHQPALEVPLQKVASLQTEKGVINYILIIGVNTRKGIRNFYYRLGRLPENQNEKFKKISEFIASSRLNNEIKI